VIDNAIDNSSYLDRYQQIIFNYFLDH